METTAMLAEFRNALPEILEGRDPLFLEAVKGRVHCGSCNMDFVVGSPRRTADGRGNAVTRCATPGCGQRFWHTLRPKQKPPVRVGVFPGDFGGRLHPIVRSSGRP